MYALNQRKTTRIKIQGARVMEKTMAPAIVDLLNPET
jgi:hypothetical protein